MIGALRTGAGAENYIEIMLHWIWQANAVLDLLQEA